jgi:hypothetical protein
MKPSGRWQWNKADTIAFLKEALKYAAPYLIVIIPVLIGQIPKDYAYASAIIWVLSRIVSALTLWYQGK